MEKSSNSIVIKSSLNVISRAIRDVTDGAVTVRYFRVVVARMARCNVPVRRIFRSELVLAV